ncbi:MAG: hypothetical protein COB49_00600 [Alphaproteobacteria bacterium]|nr:MAG: hypothetical protein COB49_00600 [Alphaproteobacteria bacterium]
MSRQLRKIDYQRLMAATRTLTGQCGGTEGAAEITRVNKVSMSNYGNINMPGHFAPVDVVADLEDFSQDMPVTRALATMQGCVLLQITPSEGGVFGQHLADFGKEVADVFAKMGEGLADDGDIDPQEAAAALPEVEDVLRVVVGLYDALKARAGGAT